MRLACTFVVTVALSFASQHVRAEPVFRCLTSSRKIIEVTQDPAGSFVYSFGRAASPELLFVASREAADIQKWSGIGRYQNYRLGLPNKGTRYEVFYSWDSLAPSEPPEAGVEVYVGEKLVATVACSKKHPVIQNVYGLP